MLEGLKVFIEVAELGYSAIEKSDKLTQAFKRLWNRIKYGHAHVAIFGPPGAGKSTLGKFLSGSLGELTSSAGYIASADVEPYALSSDLVCTITALPGQERLRDETWTKFYRSIASGKSSGIVNVVSYGYQAIDISYKRHAIFKEGMTKEEFLKAYVVDRRNEEIRILKDISTRLKDAPGEIWMITLITKQDLWWHLRNDVDDHYRLGEYNSIIEDIRHVRGTANFKHRYLSASLLWNIMRDGEAEVLIPTAGGYEQGIRAANLIYMANCIDSLIKAKE